MRFQVVGLKDIMDTTAWDRDPHLRRSSHLKSILVVALFFLIECSSNASDEVE